MIKDTAKKGLISIGLYEFAHKIWIRRPNLRILCWNAGFRVGRAYDGLPIPPTRLIELVTTGRVICRFLHGGKLCHESILFALRKNGFHVEDFNSILDFGCGCGRVMRYWHSVSGPRFYGTDYNPELISWCQKNLDFAEFSINDLKPPLDYADEKFDLIYAISVFTHLSKELQDQWMMELNRIIKPNGILLITLHGESRLHKLTPGEQLQFRSGQLVVKQENVAGTNFCGAYHPYQYVRDHLAKAYEILDFILVGARDADQDIYLLRKSVAI